MSVRSTTRGPARQRGGDHATLGVAGILLATAAAACTTGEANEADFTLSTATVTRQSIVSSVEATGTIEPIRIMEVKSQAGGEILSLPVELGDKVEQGTLLVRIDPRDVRNAHEQAMADQEVAQARFEVAERQLGRIQELHESNIVTEEELETALLEHANSKAALVRAQTNLELAEDKLNDVTLRAPISGTIVERTIEEGQVVTGTRDLTGGTVLMRMADLSEVQVRTFVDETDIGRLEAGLPAQIRVEAYPERTFQGTVLKIEPQAVVQQNVTMFAVLTRILNEQDLLKPGMNSDVEIVVGRQDDVLALPNGAIKTQQEATQLASALGLDVDVQALLAETRGARSGGEPTESTPGGPEAAADPESGGEAEEKIGGVPVSRLQTMSQDDRRRWFQGLSDEERRRAFALFRQSMQEGGRGGPQQNPNRPRPAFVFVTDAADGLTLKPITIGLSNFDYTQVIDGLGEGDQVVSIPLSLIQQQDLLNRIRSRTGLPGIGR